MPMLWPSRRPSVGACFSLSFCDGWKAVLPRMASAALSGCMRRVAIIGNAGGGKSTLGRRLAKQYDLPFFSVDQIQWLPNWIKADDDVVARRLDEIAVGERWIVDGWGPWSSIERRLAVADTIIFVDFPLWMHFWLAAERQISAARGENRTDPLEGCDQLAVTKRLFEMIWRVDQDLKPQLQEMLARRPVATIYHHVTTLVALEALGGS